MCVPLRVSPGVAHGLGWEAVAAAGHATGQGKQARDEGGAVRSSTGLGPASRTSGTLGPTRSRTWPETLALAMSDAGLWVSRAVRACLTLRVGAGAGAEAALLTLASGAWVGAWAGAPSASPLAPASTFTTTLPFTTRSWVGAHERGVLDRGEREASRASAVSPLGVGLGVPGVATRATAATPFSAVTVLMPGGMSIPGGLPIAMLPGGMPIPGGMPMPGGMPIAMLPGGMPTPGGMMPSPPLPGGMMPIAM